MYALVQTIWPALQPGMIDRHRQRIRQFEVVENRPPTGRAADDRQPAGGRGERAKIGERLKISERNRRRIPCIKTQRRWGLAAAHSAKKCLVAGHVLGTV